jgi:hypothetical protein
MATKSMTAPELGQLLRAVAAAVESGDSLEGSLEYAIGTAGNLDVQASLRTGNLQGQGGLVLIGTPGFDPLDGKQIEQVHEH